MVHRKTLRPRYVLLTSGSVEFGVKWFHTKPRLSDIVTNSNIIRCLRLWRSWVLRWRQFSVKHRSKKILFCLCTDPNECSNYKKLNGADRASGLHRGNVLKCDRNDLDVSWYRFMDAAGTRMPTSPVPQHHCGTHAPGWLNGQHPSKDEGAVSRKVCFHWSSRICNWQVNVKVRNCGAYFVYYLPKTPGCWFRYCGNKGHSKLNLQVNLAMVLNLPPASWEPFVTGNLGDEET